MKIVENLEQWQQEFEQGWLAHFQATGEFDWKSYAKIKNKSVPGTRGIDLSKSRLMLISTAGAYLKDSQQPFDASNPLGDYTLRLFPASTPFEAIAYAHDHFDHTAVNQDPQVLLPLRHLEGMVAEGKIGEIAPTVISFSGYQPDVVRVVNEMTPEILEVATTKEIDAALLVPA